MTATATLPPPLPVLRDHVRSTLALAWPVVLSRSGVLFLVVVDTAMTGHAGGDELAYLAIGVTPQFPLLLAGVGLLMGTMILTAQAAGAGSLRECGAVWRLGIAHALAYGLVLATLLWFAGQPFLRLVGQAPELVAGGGAVVRAFALGLPAILLFVATALFLEGIGRPRPAMLIMIGANVLNALLNWVMIYGNLGATALGAEGAMLATTIVRWLAAAALVAYALAMPDAGRYGLRGGGARALVRPARFRRLGYPLALTMSMEATCYATVAIFAGWLGAAPLAAYQINLNLMALVYMAAIGFSIAASVRVGHAVGRQDTPAAALAGWTAMGLALLLMTAFALVFLIVPAPLAELYSTTPAVLAIAVPAMLVAAANLPFDGLQAVAMGALRGAGDVWMPLVLFLAAFWGVSVPLAYALAFGTDFGVAGLLGGLLGGVMTASLLLAVRFRLVGRRPLRRV
ncbi:MAG: MATE family efflux transporter [Alphaproteobacteria bacterium]|nr:MATE family efflux transporter [Alphaproteobacteria bacterium]